MNPPETHRTVLLVGGGHSHVQVLEDLARAPLENATVRVLVDTPIAVYSGMVPGFVAGQYRKQDLEIDIRPLADRAGARCIVRRAIAVEPTQNRVLLDDGTSLSYDLASFDIGSTVAGQDLPGVSQFALRTRPIGRFVDGAGAWIAQVSNHTDGIATRVVVVGAGAGGVELAFCLHHRMTAISSLGAEVTLVQRGAEILPGFPRSLARKAQAQADIRGIRMLCDSNVTGVSEDAIQLQGRDDLPYDHLVWVVGAVAQDKFDPGDLATDDRGFMSIRSTLQTRDHENLFAVGDCATLLEHPETAKAGVYAVRQGPVLTHNLRAALAGRALADYTPQRDFLMLLNLGDGTALGTKWGTSFQGRWVMALKDRIDRAFMRRFQI